MEHQAKDEPASTSALSKGPIVEFSGGNYTKEWTVVDRFQKVIELFAKLSPRDRYLLVRTVWVMFDLDTEAPTEETESDSGPDYNAKALVALLQRISCNTSDNPREDATAALELLKAT